MINRNVCRDMDTCLVNKRKELDNVYLAFLVTKESLKCTLGDRITEVH